MFHVSVAFELVNLTIAKYWKYWYEKPEKS